MIQTGDPLGDGTGGVSRPAADQPGLDLIVVADRNRFGVKTLKTNWYPN